MNNNLRMKIFVSIQLYVNFVSFFSLSLFELQIIASNCEIVYTIVLVFDFSCVDWLVEVKGHVGNTKNYDLKISAQNIFRIFERIRCAFLYSVQLLHVCMWARTHHISMYVCVCNIWWIKVMTNDIDNSFVS